MATGAQEESSARLRWGFLGVFIAAVLPRLSTAGRYVTTDEPVWMERSERFSDAITQFELSQASASVGEIATMPGAPTMWVGSVARLIWGIGTETGLVDSTRFMSPEGLATAQYLSAIVIALLVGWLFLAVARWAGLVPALLASLLIATDPWWAALGAVLHTDEMTALFGTIGLVCLARALGLPEQAPRPDHPGRLAALAGLALMLAPLTKVTGVGYWLGVPVLAVWAFVRHHRRGGAPWEPGSPSRLCAIAAAAGIAVVPIMWPALVADTGFQIERLRAAAAMGNEQGLFYEGSRQFYMGEGVDSPDWTFYFVSSAMRATPWLLLVFVVGLPAALVRRVSRTYAVGLLVPAAAIMFVITRAPKSFDRYALLVTFPLVVIAAIGLVDLARLGGIGEEVAGKVVVGAAAVMLLHSLWVAPWGLAYYNPATGGSRAGHENLLVGWGEGKDVALERIRELEGGRCVGVSVAGVFQMGKLGFECAQVAFSEESADYVVLYVSDLQRNPRARDGVAGRELVDVVEVRGIPYAEIWR